MLGAGVLAAEGRAEPAIARFDLAAAQLEALDMKLFAVAARRRAGELRGGVEGEEAIRASDELMRTQGIANPARMADLLAPRARRVS